MRISLTSLAIAVAVSTSSLLAAAPAHAAVERQCGADPLDPGHTNVIVTTCAEADGSTRRATSRIINQSSRPITITRFQSLISHPEYATGVCEPHVHGGGRPVPLVLQPGRSTSCSSPWVVKRAGQLPHVAVFTDVEGRDADGRFLDGTFHYTANFD